jgi:hypothetical protein
VSRPPLPANTRAVADVAAVLRWLSELSGRHDGTSADIGPSAHG